MRHVLSTAIVALVVGALAGAAVGAVARSENAVTPSAVSPINADRVDGKHAVGAGASRARRAGKLVATNAQGYLPSNILDPQPVAGLTITRVQGPYTQVNANSTGTAWGEAHVDCPTGSSVVGGGYWSPTTAFSVNSSTATDADTWTVYATLLGRTGDGWVSAIFRADVVCMRVEPGAALTVASKSRERKPATTTRRR